MAESLNKLKVWAVTAPAELSPFPTTVTVIVEALDVSSLDTKIELTTTALKSASLGTVNRVSRSVAVKSIFAFVIPWIYCGILFINISVYHPLVYQFLVFLIYISFLMM